MEISTDKFEIPAGINPFECPICFESYSAINVPTTLPCGHSCCIIHAGNLSQCFACRMDIVDVSSLRPSYALRDGAILFFTICDAEGMMNGQMIDKIIKKRSLDTIPLDQKPSGDMKQNYQEHCSPPTPSSPPLPHSYPVKPAQAPAPPTSHSAVPTNIPNVVPTHLKFHCPNRGCEVSCKTQIKLDRHLINCIHPPPTVPLIYCPHPGCEVGCKTQKKLDSHMISCPFRCRLPATPAHGRGGFFERIFGWGFHTHSHEPEMKQEVSSPVLADNTSPTSRSPKSTKKKLSKAAAAPVPAQTPHRPTQTFRTIKACGHRCSPSSLPACCRCMDRRPMQAEGTYPKYVDGEGWRNIGLRREGYCPNCK
jgi:hypothetical protein